MPKRKMRCSSYYIPWAELAAVAAMVRRADGEKDDDEERACEALRESREADEEISS